MRWLHSLIAAFVVTTALLAPPAALAAPAFVQACSIGEGGSAGTSKTCTFPGNTTAGNAVMCIVTWGSNADNYTSSVEGGGGSTFTEVGTFTGDASNGSGALLIYKVNIVGGSTTVVTTFTSDNFKGLSCIEASGIATASALDPSSGTYCQLQATPTTSANATTSPSVTTTTNGDFIFGGSVNTGAAGGGGSEFAAGTNFTEAAEYENGSELEIASEYLTANQTTAGATTATWTSTRNVAKISCVAGFKATAAAATLSSPTPSGTLGTSTTATIGATTDTTSGNFYAVVDDTGALLIGVTATQIKAGQNNIGGAADAACGPQAVSTTTPSCGVTGLTANTAYSYKVVQNSAGGDSNIPTVGTFTTAAASSALLLRRRRP